MDQNRKVLVFGATGNIGGAAARELLKRGWRVRAVTRNPAGEKARALAARGAEVVQADMEDSASLAGAFDGIERVFSVQNWTSSGVDGERRQAMRVAAAALDAQVKHLVYGSAGEGEPNSGIAHFDGKLESEAYMRSLGLPLTVVRPGPFMELLADSQFFPQLGIWGAGARVMGWDTPSPWIAVRDLGMAIANIFEAPERWIGCEISLFGDVKSLGECRAIFEQVDGKKPFRLALPLWLFGKMAGEEMIHMWHWLVERHARRGVDDLWETVEASRELCPDLLDVSGWLQQLRAPA